MTQEGFGEMVISPTTATIGWYPPGQHAKVLFELHYTRYARYFGSCASASPWALRGRGCSTKGTISEVADFSNNETNCQQLVQLFYNVKQLLATKLFASE